MSSSNRSSIIPLSFDRFRVRSIEFISPFRNPQHDKRTKKSPERSWIRKSQVHPQDTKSSESQQIDNDAAYLFHTNEQSNSKTSSLPQNPQKKKYPNNILNIQPILNVRHASLPSICKNTCPPTPCMISYQYHSSSMTIPTRVIKRPKSFDDSTKQSDFSST